MGQVKLYRKDLDTTYVYESHSYWDKNEKKHKSDRKLIGKIDPQSGKIVPTRHYKKKEKADLKEETAANSQQTIRELNDVIVKLREENTSLRMENSRIRTAAAKSREILESISKESC